MNTLLNLIERCHLGCNGIGYSSAFAPDGTERSLANTPVLIGSSQTIEQAGRLRTDGTTRGGLFKLA